MGLFGRPARLEDEEALVPEQYEDIPSLPETPSSTVIAAGATMTGALRGDGIIQVEGTVEGEIDLQGSVIVAPTGQVKGPVTAEVIRVAGHIEGAITARERLLLQRTGNVEGDITTPALEVEEGGRLNGRCIMPART